MSKPELSQSIIRNMLNKSLGSISDFHVLPEGLDSQVFSFRHLDGHYVVRINKTAEGFAKDSYVYRAFSGPNLPIPEIIIVDDLDDQHFYCISRRAPGIRVYDVPGTISGELRKSIMETLTAIGEVKVSRTRGFGRFDANGVAPYSTWHDYLVGITSAENYDWRSVSQRIDMTIVTTLFRKIETLTRFCPEERHLIHGDFGPFNLMTDTHRVTAVIDWDRAMYGDALYDIANLFFWGGNNTKHPRMDDFQEKARNVSHWSERVLCYQLRIGLQEIYEAAHEITSVDPCWLLQRSHEIAEQGLTS